MIYLFKKNIFAGSYRYFVLSVLFFAFSYQVSFAATLTIAPATGVYTTGQTFSVQVLVNTAGTPVNAADGTVSFNPRELSVVSVGRSASIFNLWTAEPSFSNSAGTVSFSGGVPTGYTGSNGSVMTITFKSLTSGAARVQISGGSVLAADGRGTNVLTNMTGGTYTLSAVTTQPAPEIIVEYVAPANTPGTPVVTSATHSDTNNWYSATDVTLNWSVPGGVTALRTSLDTSAVSVPTKVYDTPVKTISLKDMTPGVSYFHIQFKNAEGWGKVAHYKISIDNEKPKSLDLFLPEGTDLASPKQSLAFRADDSTSAVLLFKVQLDGASPFAFTATSSSSTIPLPDLAPGYHTAVIEGFDQAGNSIISSFSFTISSFDKPAFTQYPEILSAGVIPVIKGTTRPNAEVKITFTYSDTEPVVFDIKSNERGDFTFIPDKALAQGVYALSATAQDQFGAQSAQSDTIKIVVQKPGYVAVGSFLINVLSLIIPLIALCVLGWLLIIYSLHHIRTLRARVLFESNEATAMAVHEFSAIRDVLKRHETKLLSTRKTGKLTIAEQALIDDVTTVINTAERNVEKEVDDVSRLVKNKK